MLISPETLEKFCIEFKKDLVCKTGKIPSEILKKFPFQYWNDWKLARLFQKFWRNFVWNPGEALPGMPERFLKSWVDSVWNPGEVSFGILGRFCSINWREIFSEILERFRLASWKISLYNPGEMSSEILEWFLFLSSSVKDFSKSCEKKFKKKNCEDFSRKF